MTGEPGERFFLDSNILVYSVDERDARKSAIAARLMEEAASTELGVLSYQVVQECVNVMRKERFSFDRQALGEFVRDSLGPLVQVHSSMMLFDRALSITQRYQTSWYDSLIVAAAQEAGCTVIYSEDLQHGMKFGSAQVRNPFRKKA